MLDTSKSFEAPDETLEIADLPFDGEATVTMDGSPVRWESKSGQFLTLTDEEGGIIGASVSDCREIGPRRYAIEVAWGHAGKDTMFEANDVTGVSMRHRATVVIEYPSDVAVTRVKKPNPFADHEAIALPENLRTDEPYAPPRADISKRRSSVRDGLRKLLGI